MLVAQHVNFTEHIVKLINIYGISFTHSIIISMFILTIKRSSTCYGLYALKLIKSRSLQIKKLRLFHK